MELKLNYTFPEKTKKFTFMVMGAGLLLFLLGIVFHMMGGSTAEHSEGTEEIVHAHGDGGLLSTRLWANFLVNAFFFMGIGLGATFFMALKYGSEAYYSTVFKRVYEAISRFLWPWGFVFMAVVLLAGAFGLNHLYHWMDPSVYDESSPHFDGKIADKAGYFGWFFWLRFFLFFGVWIYIQQKLLKNSMEEDMVGGTKLHYKNITLSAIFLVFFGYTSSVAAWDWMMSLDVHWFSTMFGWYIFSGIWLSAIITILMTVLYLKDNGYLEYVNENHVHDLGKWIFAISFLWTYLFFCQFMLIWYANIPEEVTYFQNRLETNGYTGIFWTMFFVNFAFPMLLLMSRDSKRNRKYLIFVSLIIFFSHWTDIFVIVMPSTVGSRWHMGCLEIGMFMVFLGFLMNRILTALTKAPLLTSKHPYLEESIHHHF